LSGELLGNCVIRELNEVTVVSLGQVFADVSLVQLDNNVVVDNSLHAIDTHLAQTMCR